MTRVLQVIAEQNASSSITSIWLLLQFWEEGRGRTHALPASTLFTSCCNGKPNLWGLKKRDSCRFRRASENERKKNRTNANLRPHKNYNQTSAMNGGKRIFPAFAGTHLSSPTWENYKRRGERIHFPVASRPLSLPNFTVTEGGRAGNSALAG